MIEIKDVEPKMIANNIHPFMAVHPGEIVKDEIQSRGLSQKQVALEMGIAPTSFNEVLNGKRSLNPELALMLEAVLDIPSEPLLRLQAEHDMVLTLQDKSFIARLKKLKRIAAVF